MSTHNQLTTKELLVQKLSPNERVAYENWVNQGGASLASKTAAQFFELYLQGYSAEDIAKSNPPFDLGLIVKAKVDFDWENKRNEHIQSLSNSVHQAVQKVSLETVQFAADAISVYHKLAGERFKKYLRTGDEQDLGPFANMSTRTYKDFLEILLKMTGAGAKKEVSVTHTVVQSNEKTVDSVPANRPLSSEDAALLLEKLSEDK